jgi:glutaredoxin 3
VYVLYLNLLLFKANMNPQCDSQIRDSINKTLSDNKVVIMSLTGCPPCKKAKELLKSLNIPFHDINLRENEGFMECVYEKTNSLYAPQIFLKNKYIGGFNELTYLNNTGILSDLLK